MKYFIFMMSIFCILLFFSCKKNEEINGYKIEQTKSEDFDSIKLIGVNNNIILEIGFIINNGTISAYTIKDGAGFQSDVNLDKDGIAYRISYGNDFSSDGIYTNNGRMNGYSIEESNGLYLAVNLEKNSIGSYKISDWNNYSNTTNIHHGYDGKILERHEQVNEDTEYIEIIYENGLVEKEKWTNKN